MEVGIRELRAQLSRWVRRVQEGEEVLVTDRGVPVARLVPVAAPRAIDRLRAEGLVEPAPRRAERPASRVGASGPVSDLVGGQRR